MTYIKTKPDLGFSPKLDAPTIKGNFTAFGSVIANNHALMNTPNQGIHTNIIFENQTVDPTLTTSIDNLYSINATSNSGTQPQIFLRIPQFLPKAPDTTSNLNHRMQLTYNTVNTVGPQYQSFLPGVIDPTSPNATGAYLVYTGQQAYASPTTIVLSPVPSQLRCVIVTPVITISSGVFPAKFNVRVVSSSTFVITATSSLGSFNPDFWGYIAIGTV